MNGLDSIGVVIIGLLVRFGLPILGTVLVIWFFRRLDAHWQAEAARQLHMGTPVALADREPCWDQRHCSPEMRNNCRAYLQQGIPCWQLFRAEDGRLKEACLGCEVFRKAPVPVHL
jgi:hypothetical protein